MKNHTKEHLFVLVGFLESGKTTLLKEITKELITKDYNPYIVLNDYQNASLDITWFRELLNKEQTSALTGSCICCDGLNDLRDLLNEPREIKNSITLIESNGTTDAVDLMSHICIGIGDNYLPPIQISLVNCKNWQRRAQYNDLEAQQLQVASLVILTFCDLVDESRIEEVKSQVAKLNPYAKIVLKTEFSIQSLMNLEVPKKQSGQSVGHVKKSHWSSCQISLPEVMEKEKLLEFLEKIPKSIIRVKGCTKLLKEAKDYIYFERYLDGQVSIRPFPGNPSFGAKLIAIGPGSDPELLKGLFKTIN